MLIWFTSLALADPAVQVAEQDGTVVAVGVVPASLTEVRQVLADTDGALVELFPDVLGVEVASDGRCEDVRRKTRGLLRPLDLHVRRCPTERGWREDLASTDGAFSTYASEWSLAPGAGGTRVEYRVKLGLRLPVPSAAVLAEVTNVSRTAVERLIARFDPSSRRADGR